MYESGHMKITPEKFEWNNLIDEVIYETSGLAKNKSQNILVKDDVCNNEIFADKFQLKRVLVNPKC